MDAAQADRPADAIAKRADAGAELTRLLLRQSRAAMFAGV